ncbi:MAG: hypothetical protein IM534_02530 [Chitinophagaceae bacterium]|jgi:hypothetical protein|nr:hypothetical protein [Chitinophagaceae bacterium]MCA6490080.1 hypothetical protein [Chitinophagaceae bacterium]MCA6495326.1 hypothetical protein [Chitinophagaceae bacterium]MCA6499997.1 hypothetical protein [Chitinophagaceae bacterium]MCA6515195.1 hypothetical protein [Chitinophagaceae bacterium]
MTKTMLKNNAKLLFISWYLFTGCITDQPDSTIADLLANQRTADCREDATRFNFCIRNSTPYEIEDLVINPQQTAIYFGSLKPDEITCMVHVDKAQALPLIKTTIGKKVSYILQADTTTNKPLTSGRYIYELIVVDSIQKTLGVKLIEASNEETGLVTYRSIDSNVVARLNAQIQSKGITDLTALAHLYHPPVKNAEGNYYYKISSRLTGPNTTELILTESGLMDDSVKGIKTMFIINTTNKVLEVVSMKESFLCYRSKQGWSSELCD